MRSSLAHDRPLRVAINCQILPGRGEGGLETFLIGLIHALGRLGDDPEEYVIIGPAGDPEWMNAYVGPNQRIVHPRFSFAGRFGERLRRLFGRQVPISDGFYESLGCDVLHFPYQHFVICALPTIYNPHDLQYLHYPQHFAPSVIAWRECVDRAGCHFANTVGVSSGWGKGDIVRHYGVDSAKVQVIPGAPPTQAYAEPRDDAVAAVRGKYALEAPFALYPAMTWEHKNHIRLLQALALLRDRDRLRVRLVCTGQQNRFWPQIEARLHSLGLHQQVRFLGMVPSDDLRAIYRLAQFVVIPTLFEATSAPLLEAWQDGTPAACSNVTALPEQAGDAALLFDPLSVEAVAEAVARMTTDPSLREDLRRRGAKRLQAFSWERTAKAYRAVYRRAAGRCLSEEDRWLLGRDWSRQAHVE